MKKILYIANPESIHDIKWASYFPNAQTAVYLCYEKQNTNESYEKLKNKLSEYNIHLLPPIESFSLIKIFQLIRSIIKLRHYIKTYDIDLIHVLFATPHAFWAFFLNRPFFITTRGSDILIVIPELLKKSGYRTIYNQILFYLLKVIFNKATNITGTSVKQVETTKKLFNNRNTSLIRTGVPVEEIINSNHSQHIPKKLKGRKYIFCPRYLQPIYRNEMVIEAFYKLPFEIKKEMTLVFILGKKKMSPYQDNIIKSLKDNHINFVVLEYLSQKSLWATYHHALVTVMTPLSDGTPNSALEAMTAYSPLVLGNLSYDSDLFDNTCLRMKSDDISELTSLLEIAITNYPEHLKEQAFQRVNNYGNRNIEMDKLKELYYNALS